MRPSASLHSTSPPRLRRLLTASWCRGFHSRVSSLRVAYQRARTSASSSVRVNLTLCMWPFCGKKNGSEESGAFRCVVSAATGRGYRSGRRGAWECGLVQVQFHIEAKLRIEIEVADKVGTCERRKRGLWGTRRRASPATHLLPEVLTGP